MDKLKDLKRELDGKLEMIDNHFSVSQEKIENNI